MTHLRKRPGWKRWLPRSPKQLFKREKLLCLLGLVWVVQGMSALESTGSRSGNLLHENISIEVRGWVWIVSGIIAVIAAWRPPGMADTFGWAALYIMPMLRSFSYILAWVASFSFIDTDLLKYFTDPYEDGWRFGLIYVGYVGTIILCAGWPNPIRTEDLERSTEGG